MSYLVFLLDWTICYVLLGYSLNVLAGYTKINTLAVAGTYGAGAYVFAIALKADLLGTPLGVVVLVALAMVAAALVNVAIAAPTLRISGAHFIVASLGLQYMLYDIFRNSDATGGPVGISGISLGLPSFSTHLITLVVGSVAVAFIAWLLRSSFGRTLYAIKDDETLSRAMGISILRGKMLSAAVAGAIAGLAGVIFALNQTYIDPESFTLHTTILVYAIILIGGSGTRWGPILGGAIVMILPELLSLIAMPPEYIGPSRRLFFGLILLVLLFTRPEGLLPRYPTVVRRSPEAAAGPGRG